MSILSHNYAAESFSHCRHDMKDALEIVFNLSHHFFQLIFRSNRLFPDILAPLNFQAMGYIIRKFMSAKNHSNRYTITCKRIK